MKKKNNISEKEIEHIAWLAKIQLSNEEKKLYTEQINSILEYFKIIDELNTGETPPTFNVLGLTNIFRDDVVKPSLLRGEALKNASRKERGYIKAPKII